MKTYRIIFGIKKSSKKRLYEIIPPDLGGEYLKDEAYREVRELRKKHPECKFKIIEA